MYSLNPLDIWPKTNMSRNPVYKNEEVKERILERLDNAINDSAKLTQSIAKASKSHEILSQCTKAYAGLDSVLAGTEQNLCAIRDLSCKLDSQTERVEKGLVKVVRLCESVDKVNQVTWNISTINIIKADTN